MGEPLDRWKMALTLKLAATGFIPPPQPCRSGLRLRVLGPPSPPGTKQKANSHKQKAQSKQPQAKSKKQTATSKTKRKCCGRQLQVKK